MKRWAVIGAGLLGTPAAAHHSTSMYDRGAPLTIDAEVVEFRWVNPHSYLTVVDGGDAGGIFLEATLADGTVMTYSTERPTE